MPIKPTRFYRRKTTLVALACSLAAASCAWAQTDDSAPFYAGASVGLSHVSNVYRVSSNASVPTGASNGDRITSAGLLAGINKRFGRQHLTLDGSLQNNRYAENSSLDNRSYSLRSALDWETVGDLSGTFSAQSRRSLAQFNLGSGAEQVTEKNLERNQDYAAIVRLGVGTRYSVEGSLTRRSRDFSAPQYDRFTYNQHATGLGVYAKPGGNVRLGLAARRTDGEYPRYPVYVSIFRVGSQAVDFKRDDVDLTASWAAGASSQLVSRISTSRVRYEPASTALRDFHGTTGAVSWTWQPTGKFNLGLQVVRDTGQETLISASDVNRVYTSWQFNSGYALTGKLSLNASATSSRSHREDNAFDNERSYGLGLRWAFSRGFSLSCQVNHASRDSSVQQYVYSANSYGCTGQALVF